MLIAVVDDDGFAREAIVGLLKSLGHATLDFGAATEFLALAVRSRPDCLICDMRMPEMTGLDLHRRLVAAGIAIPTILATAFPGRRDAAEARAAGVFAYLPKPLQATDLTALLRSIAKPDA